MEPLGDMFPFNLIDKRWFYSPIVPPEQGKTKAKEPNVPVVPSVGCRRGATEGGAVKKIADVDCLSSKSAMPKKLESSSYMPSEEEMRKVFTKLDENNDGVICTDELGRFMKRLGFEMSKDDLASLVRTVDDNCNGSVDFDEFYSLYSSLRSMDTTNSTLHEERAEQPDDDLRHAFEVFDKDRDGFITVDELRSVLVNLGMSEGNSRKKCAEMIASVDVDGDGQVNFEEFKNMMTSDAFQIDLI